MTKFEKLYLLRKIATTVGADSAIAENGCIEFKNHIFKKLLDYDFEIFLEDLHLNSDFKLKIIDDPNEFNEKNLYLTFTMKYSHKTNWKSRIRILYLCFKNVNQLPLKIISNEEDKMTLSKCFYITSRLYEMLREAHNNEELSCENVKVQHELLIPKLRPYQIKAVQWLLHRETATEIIPDIYSHIQSTELRDQEFFINTLDLTLIDYNPGIINFPSGGILADEMGLGKTVEILALILLNRRNLNNETSLNATAAAADIYPNYCEKRIKRSESKLFCVCKLKRKGKMINCCECGALQHERCVRKYAKGSSAEHLCPCCWENKGLIETAATIIVSPESIKLQWYSEINRHVKAPLKILVYEGISQMRWISPKELAEYDIILTDYNILKREINFSTTNKSSCNLRRPPSYMRVASPLTMVRWWRVCLDEGQMVESVTTKCSLMVKTLPTIHRWAVTGTPIQKSIEDLRGLLEFLDVKPFFEKNIFGNLVSLFQEGDTTELLNVLKKIMWRTCKSTVLEELGIPPQNEEVHYVFLSDVEKLFYQSQHAECAAVFEEKVRKLEAQTTIFSKMNPKILKLLLDPLKKLRQDCTVPVLFQKSDQCIVRKLLQPKELLEHLKSTNEIECKSQLRTIASCYNGMAGLHFIKGEIPEAIKMYEAVLRRAKDYTDTVCVDSLLQIHALHNIIIAHETLQKTNCDGATTNLEMYREQYTKLEWKYIETSYNNLKKVKQNYCNFDKAIKDAMNTINNRPDGNWWRNIIYEADINNCVDQLITRINDEKKSIYYGSTLYSDFTTSHGVDYFLTIWLDEVLKNRKEVLNAFEHFKEFTNNVKPKIELSEDESQKVNAFIKTTFDCHLNMNVNEDEENRSKRKEKKKVFCSLCKAKKLLSTYECIIFDKVLRENEENAEGSWNPTLQETTMKVICHFARMKNISEEDIRVGENYLHLIDCIRKEYKELGKLWIETEFTVKAYDELNMCKIRLQLGDPEEMKKKENKTIYQIVKEEMDLQFLELTAQLETAELEFIRKTARLKYIKHLENNTDPGICPICNLVPDSKYTVLECGHHLCLECLQVMRKYQRFTLTCSVCRNQQKYENIYFVTCKPANNRDKDVTIRGHYSSKIEEIIRTVLQLKDKEDEVKILIFSHWDGVLQLIANALKENDISYRIRAGSSGSKAILEFKNKTLRVTCLLLLLSQGSKGLNLIEATHVFLVEPILNPGEEQQAIGRVHRIGQTRPTTVHRFICKNTIEEQIFDTVSKDQTKIWELNDITIDNIRVLFSRDRTD